MRGPVPCLIAMAVLLSASAQAETSWLQKDRAVLRALDKITGRSTDIEVEVGKPVTFGSLSVDLKVCYQTPPEEAPESAAFLQVSPVEPVSAAADRKADPSGGGGAFLFSGWMFASSPGLSALEHPVYDVWVIECEAPDIGRQ